MGNTRNDAFSKIDIKKIGQGKFLTEGKFGARRNIGLRGQLGLLKKTGGSATKNISKKNLDDMSRLISDRLKKHSAASGAHISSRDRKVIMREAEKLVKTKGSGFSREDKKDLEKIVKTMEQKGKDAILGKNEGFGGGGNYGTTIPTNPKPPAGRALPLASPKFSTTHTQTQQIKSPTESGNMARGQKEQLKTGSDSVKEKKEEMDYGVNKFESTELKDMMI